MIKEVWTDILIKEDETFNKKKKSRLYHNSKRIRIKILVFNIYKTRETTIYKRLLKRLTLQEINTTKQIFI